MSLWQEVVQRIVESPLLQGALSVGVLLGIFFCILLLLLGVTFLLRRFFRRHPFVDRAHRMLAYMVTMAGVVILIFAGLLGMLLPVIPGIVLVLFALVLLRKYHKNKWLDSKISYIRIKMRLKRSVKRLKARIRRRRIGKKFKNAPRGP